ncbi:hypothetical protein [Pedobacter sp. KLB.chiD]|uniref:hypothetical protein n=1 Tax=Pedobacter sp. KLB.chiD TaxID=3387402 RepID=UPI0039999092
MIIVVEPQMQGEKHVIVNAGILEILQITFPGDTMHLYADELHSKRLLEKPYLSKQNLVLSSYKYKPKEDKKTNIALKLFRQARLSCKMFRQAKKHQAKLIVFTSCFPFTALFVNFLAGLYKQKIIICHHGDLGVLLLDKNKLVTKIFRYFIKKMMVNRNLKFNNSLIYGKSIKDKLIATIPSICDNSFIVIDHPYEYYGNNLFNKAKGEILTLSNIGTATLIKNSESLFDLAQILRTNISNNELKLTQIGSVATELQPFINEFVDVLKRDGSFIPNSVFEESLAKSDYFIYFFKTGGYYELCPSGTFFDAIKYLKPIIAIKNSYLEYYFDKLGNIGYLCESIDDMAELIRSIIKGGKKQEYFEQLEKLKNAQTQLLNENISKDFERQLCFVSNHILDSN